ncbi:hypothetical protein C8A00DRAFT_12854 [Chaetomidium leptoderma]|uniref:F-box domain-containing protein n=1 Tax=Chaetomidium leptoderma TaxID=669021 RepID=A0AAN6VU04_9PEZI|nr:hypothetical protein C8A00DRAFT_12854 [Chaetomidium leptoderma]
MARPRDAARTSPLPSLSPPLLRLTPHIRQRIYRYLGLASWDSTPHRYYLHAGQLKLRHGRGFYEMRFVPDPSCFHGLLLSCRAIYTEAAALLYSANQFILYYSEPREDPGHPTSLRPLHTLHALTASSLLSLSNLKIVLNEAACHQLILGDCALICCLHGRKNSNASGLPWCKKKHGGVHQLPLLSPASAGDDDDDKLAAAHAVLREWHSAAARLLPHVTPGRLVLSLVCDIDPEHPRAIDIANSAVAPIRRLLPPSYLRECHIRLAKTTDSQLQQLAQDTVSHACGIPTPTSKPPSSTTTTLTTLPRELRIRILEYTDLITPRRQVIWTRQDRAYIVYHFQCEPHDPPDERHSNQFSDCWRDRSFDGGPPSNGCFCRRRHAAFSPTCKCWAPPGPALFLVCRTLYEDAQLVFFSSNRFIVHDYKLRPSWALPLLEQREEDGRPVPTYPYPNERFTVSEFLRHVVPTRSLAYLRFLEIVFPPYRPPSWPETQHPAMQDWWSTVDWLRDKINPPGLSIRLIVVDVDSAPRSYYRTITVEEGKTVMTAYMNLLRPLTRLAEGGLARFYAHFPYPWEWTEESRTRRLNDPYWVLREEEALKERAERYVMGHRYESLYANGREEPGRSDWGVADC